MTANFSLHIYVGFVENGFKSCGVILNEDGLHSTDMLHSCLCFHTILRISWAELRACPVEK